MTTRIYEVEDTETALNGDLPRLIEAPNAAQAVRFVSKRYIADVCSAMRVAELMGQGVKVEKAEVKS